MHLQCVTRPRCASEPYDLRWCLRSAGQLKPIQIFDSQPSTYPQEASYHWSEVGSRIEVAPRRRGIVEEGNPASKRVTPRSKLGGRVEAELCVDDQGRAELRAAEKHGYPARQQPRQC